MEIQPAHQNHQTTNRAPNEPARPIFAQESIFLGKIWPLFYERKQKFWYPHNGQTTSATFPIVFWSAMGSNGPKMPMFGQNCQICILWTKFGCFWAKNLILTGVSKSFGTLITENHLGILFPLFFGQAWGQLGVIFRGSTRFLAILGHSHFAIISILNFGLPPPHCGPWGYRLPVTALALSARRPFWLDKNEKQSNI